MSQKYFRFVRMLSGILEGRQVCQMSSGVSVYHQVCQNIFKVIKCVRSFSSVVVGVSGYCKVYQKVIR